MTAVERTYTEQTLSGVISYIYLYTRSSNSHIQLLNVSITLPSGLKIDLTEGFVIGSRMVVPSDLRAKFTWQEK